jgi:exodeoxyribonuclease VII large subunit
MRHRIERGHTRLERAHARLHAVSPTQRLQRAGPVLVGLRHRLHRAAALSLERRRARLAGLGRSLEALSPLATLERGYSITRRAADGAILRDAKAAAYGDLIETRLADGRLLSRVEKRET